MKKIIIITAIVITSVAASLAQDAKAIVEKYMKTTNMSSISTTNSSFYTDIAMTISQNGMNMDMGIKAVINHKEGNMRMNMSMDMMGQQMLFVVNGDKGWMKMGDQVMPMPKEQMDQIASQGNMMGNMMWDVKNFDFKHEGEENGLHKIRITAKDTKKEILAKFNKETGLLERMDLDLPGIVDAETVITKYKQHGNITLPEEIKMMVSGKETATVTIKEFKNNHPVNDEMFAEPK